MNSTEKFNAFTTLLRKEIRRFMRIWVQTILPPMITTTLYFIIFGNLIGSRIGEMAGYRYMDYIVPGVIMMAVITNSYANVVSSFYSSKFQRSVEELLVSPMPEYLILLGYVAGGMARGLIVGIAVTGVSMFFADLQIQHMAVAVSIIILTATLFALTGFLNGMFARSFDDISIVPTFILTPLNYLGGVFYTITLLPEFWQHVSMANPILYLVNAFRYGFLGFTDIDLMVSYSIGLGAVATLFTVNLVLLKRGYGIRS